MTRRPRFEPAALVAGLVFLAVAVGGGCDAAGVWHPKPVLLLPVLGGGLVLMNLVRLLTAVVRRRGVDSGTPTDAHATPRGPATGRATGRPDDRGTAPASVSDDGAARR